MEIDFLYIGIVIGVILLSMTLHEAMHAFVGYWLGDDTAKREGRLTLNPIKHIDPFLTIILPVVLALIGGPIFGGAKPVPFRPDMVKWGDWGAALIALAGPLTNFILAFVIFGIWVLLGTPSATEIGGLILQTAIIVNLGFFVFNMLPIPPLDGSRALYAVAPEMVRSVMRTIEQFGLIFIFALVLLGSSVLGQFMQAVMSAVLDAFYTIFRLG